MSCSRAAVAVLALLLTSAAGPGAAQGIRGLAERVASLDVGSESQSVRLLDAELVTLLRWRSSDMPPIAGPGGTSEFRLAATPVASLFEQESSSGAFRGRNSWRLLPVLGGRLVEYSSRTSVDVVSGAPQSSWSWSFLKIPGAGPLLGVERREGKLRFSFLFFAKVGG